MSDTIETLDVKQTVTNPVTQVSTTVAAHYQKTTIHIQTCVPPHEARESDPHYKFFNQARARLIKLGKMVCWVNNHECAGDIELHHDKVEFSLQRGIDIAKFEETYPEFGIKTDEEFLEYIEGEGNLTPLCRLHHIGLRGIHLLPYPLWLPQRFWKADVETAALVIPANASCGDTESQHSE